MADTQRGIGGTRRVLVIMAAVLAVGGLRQRADALADPCGGDCNLNGEVGINELILGVNITLDATDLAQCEAMDLNQSGQVEINELVTGVTHALGGCPAITCTAPTNGRCVEIAPGAGAQDALLTALLDAQPHDVIFLKQGHYDIDSQLSLDVDDVTIQGEGMNRSVLSFANQNAGGEGLLVQANHFTLEDVGFEDGPGDLVKIVGADGVTIRGVRTEWTGGPKTSNGSYGLYPVQCRDVLIEDSVVIGAADAGVYVGQSRNIIVQRNRVEFNVAGIEIENSTDADVHDNVATNNAGGVLVFNLPGPPVQGGRRTRIYANQIYENNHENFGAPGSTVSVVPPGTGSLILSNDQVEVFNNTFRDNDTSHVILISYNTAVIFGEPQPDNPDFDAFSEGVYVHDNTYIGGGMNPPDALAPVVNANGGVLPLPNIIFDGDVDQAKKVGGQLPMGLRTCIHEPSATFIDIDLSGDLGGVTKDLAVVDCMHDTLPPITIGTGRHIEISPGPDAQDQLLTALLEAIPGDDILIKAGTYDFTSQLSLTVDHVTLRGEGMDQTVLRFSGLTTAGESLLVRANDFTLADLALEDSPGDQFKAEGADGLRIQRVRAEWTNGPDEHNGAYGVYPVQCKDVLIEDSVAIGASDTGIYVGQSRNIIVRRNRVEFNVAGIEIENSTGADVHDNMATNNAGGILVFNLPGLQVFGERTRVYNNESFANNTLNFAPAGNIVAGVPTGTGIMILANDQIEVFGNSLRDNNSSQITLISYNTAQVLGGVEPPNNPEFDPFSESIYIHDNTYVGGGTSPLPQELRDVLTALLGGLPVPQIVYDGDVDPNKLVGGTLPDALRTCIQEPAATFVNLNVPLIAIGMPMVSRDLAPYDCSLERLTPIAIAGVQ